MKEKRTAFKKVLSVFLVLTILAGMIPAFAISAAVADTRIADPSTMDSWKEYFGSEVLNTENAGYVWTDKSVFTSADEFDGLVTMDEPNDNFLVALSAISSNKSIKGYSHIPTDTMLVLDVSGSMGTGEDNNNAVKDLVTAANNALTKLLKVNNYNRVGVVLYSGNTSTNSAATPQTGTVLLSLDRYTATNDSKTFLTATNNNDTVSIAAGVKDSSGKTVAVKEKNANGGTYTQNGIYKAMQEFLAVEDTTIEGEGFQAGAVRMPIMVLMSDGAPTIATNNYAGTTDKQGNSTLGNTTMGNGSTPSSTILADAIYFVNQLTASYARERIEEHYGRTSLFYTLGFKVNSKDVLDPENSSSGVDAHWSTYNATAQDANMQLAVGQYWQEGNRFQEGKYVTVYQSVQKSSYDLRQDYVDQYFNADKSLTAAFDAIVQEIIIQSLYYPTLVEEGDHNYEGYIEILDDIGLYMEVKDIKGIMLGETLYTGELLAKNFTEDGDALGTVDTPNEFGMEMIRSIVTRLGIEPTDLLTAEQRAMELAVNAQKAGQLSYDEKTGEYSNYIGWYADKDGNYLGFASEDDANPMNGAVYFNKSYGMLGEVSDGHKQSDMMFVSIQIHTNIETGTSQLIYKVPASLIPVISYNIELTGTSLEDPGAITLTVDDTVEYDSVGDGVYDSTRPVTPITLVYEVGLKDEINELTVADIVSDDYAYEKDGTYYFYTNQWSVEQFEEAPHPTKAINTVAYFEPSVENERYYYTENSTVYVEDGEGGYVAYVGTDAPRWEEGKYFRKYARFEVSDTVDEGNAIYHTVYEAISEESIAKAVKNGGNTWYIPIGTVHRTYSKAAADQLNKTENETDTLPYSAVPGFDKIADDPATEEDESHVYADAVLGNNGRMSINAAQGVKITKAVDSTLAGRDDDYTFEIKTEAELSEPEYRTLRVAADGTQAESTVAFANDGAGYVATVTLKAGEAVYILDLPEGAAITVTEDTEGKDYIVSAVNGEAVKNATLTVEANDVVSADFVNTLKPPVLTGNLVLTKNVEHPFGASYTIPDDIRFDFELTFTDELGEVTDRQTVQLAYNETVSFVDIEIGTTVTVKEINIPEGFTSDADNDTKTVVIEGEENYVVSFTNTYDPEKVSPVNITVAGDKTLTGRENDNWLDTDEFRFLLQKRTESGWVDVEAKINGSDTKALLTVTKENKYFDFSAFIQAEEYTEAGMYSYRILEVYDANPYLGITYDSGIRWFDVTVEDADMDGYLEIGNVAGYSGATVSKIDTADTETWAVYTEFHNVYAPAGSASVTINIDKTVEDLSGGDHSEAGFTFGLYQNGVLDLVSEETNATGETAITLVFGASDIGRQVRYTLKEIIPEQPVSGMTYSKVEYIVHVEVLDDTMGGVIANVSVHTTDAAQDVLPETNTATASFVNTYDPDDASLVIDGTKTLVGRDIRNGEFTFVLTETDESFQPVAGVSAKRATNVGTSFAFDAITYSEIGTYYYTVTEEDGGLGGVAYDESVHYVTVTVTDNGEGALVATAEIAGGEIAFTNTYTFEGTSVTLTADKTLTGKDLEENMFTFEVVENGEAIRTAKNDADGNITFETIEYTEPGTHTYTVREKAENRGGITYDDTEYTVTVNVVDNGEGELVATVTGGEGIVFENTYDAEKTSVVITADKTLTGKDLEENMFTFEVVENGEAIRTAKNDADGNITFEAIEYTEPGTHTYTVREKAGEDEGITYDETEYTVTVTVTDDGEGNLVAAVEVDGEAIVFNNTYTPPKSPDEPDEPENPEEPEDPEKNEEPDTPTSPAEPEEEPTVPPTAPDTGLRSNIGLWVLLLLSGSTFGVILLLRKKRREED